MLKAQGLSDREIAQRFEIPWTSFHREKQRYTIAHPSTPEPQSTTVHPGTPALRLQHTPVHPGTPNQQPARVHRSTPSLPVQQPTTVHRSTPLSDDVTARLLSLLPDLEIIVVRERNRQRLVSTPIGTPRHTTMKTYVVDTLYVDLIERYARAEGVELKDVVNLAFHEFFERRDYLPKRG
jgi:hypothetical protein